MIPLQQSKLLGKQVEITDKASQYFGHWGYIKMFDGDVYHISGGSISSSYGEITPIFDRSQFKVKQITKNKSR